ncbi:MAG: preprotein translocase subunit SecG [Candidatus Moraniibacteriota bacterium]|nr:MAG: preprotein translocase subunit SecG [Candidatus Moranbacteria bacterium]
MHTLEVLQVIVSLLLIVSILMQNRGSSLGGGFGGDSFSSYHTKRGFEKFLVRISIFLSFAFLALSLANVWTVS